jgi:thiol-disulfide isomerase/thioredoxin
VSRLIAVVVAALAVGGCRPAAGPGRVSTIDEKQLADVLRQNRGKVVLVDFWATSCLPCLALFPHTVGLERRYAARGLAVLSVSLDDPADEAAVSRFLADQKAAFPCFISRYGMGSRSVEAFEVDQGSIPYLKLYDREGKLSKTFGEGGEEPSPERIEAAVKELLAPKT